MISSTSLCHLLNCYLFLYSRKLNMPFLYIWQSQSLKLNHPKDLKKSIEISAKSIHISGMSSENHHLPHHYFYHQNLHIHRRTSFLPMLCARPSSSMKDVSLPQWRDQPGSFSNDPLSPRIGCMGQVKVKRHNKIVELLTTKTTTTITNNNNIISPTVKHAKLKKFFSGKNLTTITTNNVTVSSVGARPRGTVNSGNVPRSHNKQRCKRNENVVPISIENMDLPLPVIKRVQKPEDSLWKRRSGGAALKTLQLHQIQLKSVR